MSYELGPDEELPRPLRAARVLLFLGAAFTVLAALGTILVVGSSAEVLGGVVWRGWPGVAAFLIALRLPTGGRRLFWFTVVVCGFWILGGLGSLGAGSPRGITQLILPVGILVLITRPPAKGYLLG